MNDVAVVAFATVVAVTVAVHFAFIGYLVIGGFLAWRWPRSIGLHVLVVVWGISSIACGLPCPLTDLERWGRAGAGMNQLPPDGFIAHYLTGVLYPVDYAVAVHALAFAAVAASWLKLGQTAARRWRDGSVRLVPDGSRTG
ncbi:DUF2784 domain-containing protein [Mycobacterium hubeiense]|uniref:DUF2784 domain-containing protein n=1 Tax=Mycobacterium hubeiense TaxID=1867256 RepID=UPI000C7F22FC|nr:DUF2784 domain-containing protein [Mycobacterium sp. QGD 101]